MKDWNTCFAYLNMELPDDIRRLKEAGYYNAAIARIDAYLAEDWTKRQNQPLAPAGALPVNPTSPHGVTPWRHGSLAQREILRRLPLDYTVPGRAEAEPVAGPLWWTYRRGVRGTGPRRSDGLALLWKAKSGTSTALPKRWWPPTPSLQPVRSTSPVQQRSWGRLSRSITRDGAHRRSQCRHHAGNQHRHESDEAFACALCFKAAGGRDTARQGVAAAPAACPAQSNITLDSFTVQPTYIAPETAPQRTAYWEADLAENCRFGAQYSYRSTAHYAAPLELRADPVQPDFDTAEQLPHIAFTPYMKALAAQLTEGITDPVQKAKRIYDFVTLNVHYHFQPMYFVHENITDNCARSRRGDCGVMAATLYHPLPHCRHPGQVAERHGGTAGDSRLPRLGNVLHRAQGLDVRRLLCRCVYGACGQREDAPALLRQSGYRPHGGQQRHLRSLRPAHVFLPRRPL